MSEQSLLTIIGDDICLRKNIGITIEEELVTWLEAEAKKRNMSVSRLIENLVIKEKNQ